MPKIRNSVLRWWAQETRVSPNKTEVIIKRLEPCIYNEAYSLPHKNTNMFLNSNLLTFIGLILLKFNEFLIDRSVHEILN
jgi:hypothetical protein